VILKPSFIYFYGYCRFDSDYLIILFGVSCDPNSPHTNNILRVSYLINIYINIYYCHLPPAYTAINPSYILFSASFYFAFVVVEF